MEWPLFIIILPKNTDKMQFGEMNFAFLQFVPVIYKMIDRDNFKEICGSISIFLIIAVCVNYFDNYDWC